MTKQRVRTALQTKKCPPHYFFIDDDGIGRCQKCSAVTNFRALQRRYEKSLILLDKSTKGGRKNKGD